MAVLSDLVTALAAATGLPGATVFAYGRFAREAGLISQKGRGRGAAEVTTKDAANLLLAVGATGITRESGNAIKSYRRLKGHYLLPTEPNGKRLANWLRKLGSNRQLDTNLGQFLEFLISQSIGSDLNELLRSIPVLAEGEENWSVWRKHPAFTLDMLFEKGAVAAWADPSLGSQVGIELHFKRLEPFAKVTFYRQAMLGKDDLLTVFFSNPDAEESFGDFSVDAYLTELSVAALGSCLSAKKINFKNKKSLRATLFPPIVRDAIP